MISRRNGDMSYVVENLHEEDSLRLERDIPVDNYAVRSGNDPFPDNANFDLLEQPQEEAVTTRIKICFQLLKNSLPPSELRRLCAPIPYSKAVLKVTLPGGPLRRLKLLRIISILNAGHIRVRL